MAPWLSIVGMGEDGLSGLSAAARAQLDAAEVLVGGARHLAMVPEDGRERLDWPSPLSDLIDELVARRGQRVCVLATGDPLCYGVATTLLRHIPLAETLIIPAPSAFSLACARLGWSLPDVETLTLHGRPVSLLQPYIQPGARLLILSNDAKTPEQVAEILCERGFGASHLTALEHMGGPRERRLDSRADAWDGRGLADFHTLAVTCEAGPAARRLSRLPGLPDDAFRHDGCITKREIRAATLAALAPAPGELLWDVGAGSGSVAIEWMRSQPRCRAVAIERRRERLALAAANAEALGVPRLTLAEGEAPAALAGLEAPDAVFLGGGIDSPGLFEACWQALRPGGRLVANAVTLEGEGRLLALHASHGGRLVRLAISRAEPLGPFKGWRPLMPVTQWAVERPWEAGS